MKKITLADIAKKTGYSVNTVSHALRDMKDISDEVKAYISAVADDMGYIPNASASVLKSGKTKNIVIITEDMSDPHYCVFIRDAEVLLRKHGYNCFIISTGKNDEERKSAVITALSKNADGVIICPSDNFGESLKLITSNSIPCIQISEKHGENSLPTVIIDMMQAGYSITKYLTDMGHGEILYIGTSDDEDIFSGVKKAYDESGFPKASLSAVILTPEDDIEKVIAKTNSSAIILSSDTLAIQIVGGLLKQGKKIPDDISVASARHIPPFLTKSFPITSFGCSQDEMAEVSVKTLLDVIDGKNPISKTIFPINLFYGKTTKEPQRKYKDPTKKGLSDYLL